MTAISPVFGNYSAPGPDIGATGSVTVTCVVLGVVGQSINYSLQMGTGLNVQGSQRRMNAGASYLGYNLFCDAAYNQIWGDGTGGSCAPTGGGNNLLGTLVRTFNIYGRLPRGQYVSAGNYRDSVVLSILY